MLERLDILARYSVNSPDNLEIKIKNGEVAEHPAWEDLNIPETPESALREFLNFAIDIIAKK